MICNNPQVFKLFNLFQFRVFQEKTNFFRELEKNKREWHKN